MRGNRKWTRCTGRKVIRTRVLRRFVRNGKRCTVYRRGRRTFTRCIGGAARPARHNVKDCVEKVIQSLTK